MNSEPPALAIGLMSGTSTDGVDGVLLSVNSFHDINIEATVSVSFPGQLQQQISNLITQQTIDIDQIGRLHSRLGHLYADVANQLKAKSGDDAVAVIGCHGQTIRHRPDGEFPFTMQLGSGAIVAQLTGIPTVNDFRSADMAVGGQGAPLAPAFHQAVFSSPGENRAVLNLGGIANITHLPADRDSVVTGFDTGPANTLLDGWYQRHFDQSFDRDGAGAAAGTIHQGLLKKLLSDHYFARQPPKSSGREYFNQGWLTQVLLSDGKFDSITPLDVQSTLTALTAQTVADQINRFTPSIDAVYVCGGGVHNQTLMRMLSERCQCEIRTTNELGINPQWVEASAFAWIAYKTVHRSTATLPGVTGASKPTIAGAIYFPD
jgi:anhydro-N-acetylmuramic acid kinase